MTCKVFYVCVDNTEVVHGAELKKELKKIITTLSVMLPTPNLPATSGKLRWASLPTFVLKSTMMKSLCRVETWSILSYYSYSKKG